MTPARAPKKSAYPPRKEENDLALQDVLEFASGRLKSKRDSPVLDVPRCGRNAQDAADVRAATSIDVLWEPQRQVIGERDAVGRDVRADYGEAPAETGKELRGAVVPQHCDFKRVPCHFAVDYLGGAGDCYA